jgi:UTP--glucose-1-phosphate uridylyltransferase
MEKFKGVIFAAGYGTRFLPASKTVPKELFPLIDVPAIDFTVKEMIDAGIKDILIITSRRKKVLEDYLDHEMELEKILDTEKDSSKLAKIAPRDANFHFVRQREMKGTADALNLCRSFCGDTPFIVAYPDDVIFSDIPCSEQLIQAYHKTGKTVLTVRKMKDSDDVSRYGVIDYSCVDKNIYNISKIVEKPPRGTEPSKVVSFGRYLYTPEIFDVLDAIDFSYIGSEVSQTEPLNILAAQDRLCGLEFEGTLYDVGAPFGYLTTIIEYAMTREDLSGKFKTYLKENYERLIK